ncbi:MAG: hypothetical protein WCF18_20555 [Chthoniobacteraceae bacterium]
MSVNKRRHANAVPIASFVTWVVMAIFVGGSGVGYVWCKNQLHTTGSSIKNLEHELVELRNKNEVARAHIAQLSSTKALQDRFDTGFIKLSKITDDRIVTVHGAAGSKPANELRAVSNERSRK